MKLKRHLWTPLAIASVLYVFSLQLSEFRLMTFAFAVASTNGITNPLIYGVMNKKFRRASKTIFRL